MAKTSTTPAMETRVTTARLEPSDTLVTCGRPRASVLCRDTDKEEKPWIQGTAHALVSASLHVTRCHGLARWAAPEGAGSTSRTHYVLRSFEHDAVPPRLCEEEEECKQPNHSNTVLFLFTKTHPLYVANAHSSFDSDLCLLSSPTWQIFLTIAKIWSVCCLFNAWNTPWSMKKTKL